MKKHFSKVISSFLVLAVMVVSLGAALPAKAASNQVTMYFKDTQGWGKAICYAYDATAYTAVTKNAWPGDSMTKVSDSDVWYEITVDTSKTITAVFTDGTNQTVDAKNMASGNTYYVVCESSSTTNQIGKKCMNITMSTTKPADFPAAATSTASSTASTSTKDATPKTGDNNMIAVIGTVGIVSLAAVCLLIRKKKITE